jgi:NAD(P)-dependent dehydrogenase (short-subunit alcohol dehydrogenase family)
MKNIVITGVSTGIGYATTAEFLRRGYHVFGSVRRQDTADSLQEEFGSAFTPLLFDVADQEAIGKGVKKVHDNIGDNGLTALVNNAGIVIPGPLMYMPLIDFRAQFEVNLFGLLDVTQQFLPLLGAGKESPFPPGRIVNISSVSGKIAYPFLGAYAATKHGLEALSDALRRELMLFGIDVILIEPGTTATPIKEKYRFHIQKYKNTGYGGMVAGLEKELAEREINGLPVEKVVETICKAVESKHPKTRYALPRKRFTSWLIPRWLPDRWLDRLTANRLGI